MTVIPAEIIQSYRAQTFRLSLERRLHSREDAARFVCERGFVFLWPISGVALPSLWAAVAGDTPVADEHDHPGHVTWGWKDAALGGRDWYYAKVLRKKATFISFDILPYFYALSENYGSYEDDYLTLYEQGRMTVEARQIYEALLEKGRLDTIELRKTTRMSSAGSEGRFNKALTDLQADFKIVPVTVTQSGAWHYAFAYDIAARYYPELSEQAHAITDREAHKTLAQVYLEAVGACRESDLRKLFGWTRPQIERTIADLARLGIASPALQIESLPGEWIVQAALLPDG